MRHISIGIPSGTVKMTLWEDTEDEEAFEVKSIYRGKPYVKAYGVKYYLTVEERRFVYGILGIKREIERDRK